MLLDTCALLWVTLKPEILTEQEKAIAFNAIENGNAAISAISIWEIGIKIKKGKLKIGMSLEHYVRRIQELNGIEIIPVDENIWMENLKLDWDHRDPADRTIVATALLRGCPILTKDQAILDFYKDQGWA